jgi:small glutamine-rich tetratricopeptide repeat-containing protein alpha
MATSYCLEVAASVVVFLRQQMKAPSASIEFRDSLDGAVQFLMSAYQLRDDSVESIVKYLPGNLMEIFDAGCSKMASDKENLKHGQSLFAPPVSKRNKACAEKIKDEGDRLMMYKDGEHQLSNNELYNKAVETYSRALVLDPNNATCYCNRAAAYYSLYNFQSAINDCNSALYLNPTHAKAFSRKAIACSALEMHQEAHKFHFEAARLEPDNDTYKRNLERSKTILSAKFGPCEANAIENKLESSL